MVVRQLNGVFDPRTPEILNTDQGSEFTANKFIQILQGNDIHISMDGKGRA